MNPIAWLYIKMFLIFGLGFGVVMSLMDLFFKDGFLFNQFLSRTILFGATMSIVLVSIHVAGLRGKGVKTFSRENLSPIQRRSIDSTLDKKQLIEKIITDPVLREMEIKETENGLVLKSDMSIFSYGNRIFIQSDSGGGALNHYEIVSKPALRTTLLDYGTSYNQVTHLEKLMIA